MYLHRGLRSSNQNILDNWNPGIYNISYSFVRSAKAIESVYTKSFDWEEKLGPTGKPRGLLDSQKLLKLLTLNLNIGL